MRYPTLDEVRRASPIRVVHWHRNLPKPGTSAIHMDWSAFWKESDRQKKVWEAIQERVAVEGLLWHTTDRK